MKKNILRLANIAIIFTFAAAGLFSVAAFGRPDANSPSDSFAEVRQPYDFSDKFYLHNGVQHDLVYNRRDGADGLSVIGRNDDPRYRNVRIIETFPAYNFDGSMVFFNVYGDLYKISFLGDEDGEQALKTAEAYPIYEFPSATVAFSSRQAALVNADDGYFEKNPLGLGIVKIVEFTEKADTPKGRAVLQELAERNGLSLDGTPIIRTLAEINYLSAQGLISQSVRGQDGSGAPPYAVARVIADPTMGAIASDAFLRMVLEPTGKPLADEMFFQDQFECLQRTGLFCTGAK